MCVYIYTHGHQIKGRRRIKNGILFESRSDMANHKLPWPPGTELFQQGITTTLRIWPKSSNGASLGMASQMRNAKETPCH